MLNNYIKKCKDLICVFLSLNCEWLIVNFDANMEEYEYFSIYFDEYRGDQHPYLE